LLHQLAKSRNPGSAVRAIAAEAGATDSLACGERASGTPHAGHNTSSKADQESMHMVMWTMSDRTILRSFRFMEGFGAPHVSPGQRRDLWDA
jgi:hypothetical protein